MYNYLYKIYPSLFGTDYKVLYMDTDSIYAKLNMSYEKYLEILELNKNVFGTNIGQMEVENLNKPIKEFIALSSKCYSYINKNNINTSHTKGISYSYSKNHIDHELFKNTLLNNNKPDKINFNVISVKNQKISTKKITKNNIEFLNDKRLIKDINSNIPHTLYID